MSEPADDAGMGPRTDSPLPRRSVPRERRSPVGPAAADASTHARPPDVGILRSKVQPPLLRAETLERRRLLDWLADHASSRLVVVAAEAGFGKTTLLADFGRRSSGLCFWFRVEAYDRDWLSFIAHLHAAVREVDESFGQSTEALLMQAASLAPSLDVVLSAFLADLSLLQASPLHFLLDDFHLVEDSDEVRQIMRRLLETAPQSVRFIVAARARPGLPVGRLASQGRLAELGTDDLRFTRPEVETLFRSTFGQSLEDEVIDVIEDRTEGWAASLQLVSTSIATRSPSEARDFIRHLSGAVGPIYDFLAEEVLAGLPPLTGRVLLHASLLDEVAPELVAAAMSVATPVTEGDVRDAIQEAEALGLLGRSTRSRGTRRLHPLLKDFLAHQLGVSAETQDVAKMRIAIARAAEPTDWLTAARQYAAAPEPDEALRVLSEAASTVLGTGSWAVVSDLVAGMPPAAIPPGVAVVRARALAANGSPAGALELLNTLPPSLPEPDRLLVGLARASALHMLGLQDALAREVALLSSLPSDQSPNSSLVRAWDRMLAAYRGGAIGAARDALLRHAAETSAAGLDYHSGISLYNAAVASLAQSDYGAAKGSASEALEKLSRSGAGGELLPAVEVALAIAELEAGDWEEGLVLLDRAVHSPQASPDVFVGCAYVAAVSGNGDQAWLLLDRFVRAQSGRPVAVGINSLDLYARVVLLLAEGKFGEARSLCSQLLSDTSPDLDGIARRACVIAQTSFLTDHGDASSDVREAAQMVDRQQAWRWGYRLRILEAALDGDANALRRWTAEAAATCRLGLLEMADVVAASMHLMLPLEEPVARSIASFPRRWLTAIDRQLDRGWHPAALASAQVLSEYGTLEHARRLHVFEKAHVKSARGRGLGRRLAQRVSPTLRIHDLGRTTCEIGGRLVLISEARRKASALLLFLVTKPTQTAAREQVMEQLWPTSSPSSAANSLHQTLYFLRREIDPWYEEGASADYVPMGSEVLFLNPSLVHVDSVSFLRQANEALGGDGLADGGAQLVRLYDGPFAPEFEYEEWAEDWRSHVHATFLRLAHNTSTALVAQGRFSQAVEVLNRAVELDQDAHDLHAQLIRALHAAGARDAAAERYRRWALRARRDLDADPPSLDELLDGSGLDHLG
jgi:ATP/maltotriose-dependent transcriptional regulator MalT/DNA-binding SARP family transcriptional activator